MGLFIMANPHLTKPLPQHSTDKKLKPFLHKIRIKMLAPNVVTFELNNADRTCVISTSFAHKRP
jgi:hypothetical protein